MARQIKRLLIVDGYNVLNAGNTAIIGKELDDARDALIRDLHDYAGFSGQSVVAVFDAWKSDRLQHTEETNGLLTVVFTKRQQTADHYIERLCDEYSKEVELGRLELRVATSDLVEQTVVFGRGAVRMSARELLDEVYHMHRSGSKAGKMLPKNRATVMDGLPQNVREKLERMRRGS